jgi:hypothetical protein
MPAPTSQPLLVLVLEPVIDAPVAVLLMVNLSLPTHAFYLIDKDLTRSGSAVLGRCSPAIPQPGARAIPIVDRAG